MYFEKSEKIVKMWKKKKKKKVKKIKVLKSYTQKIKTKIDAKPTHNYYNYDIKMCTSNMK